MSNPVITSLDTSSVFKSDLRFVERAIEVPASTTYAVGTILGIVTDSGEDNQGSFGGFDSSLTNGLESPVAILAEELVNATLSVVKKTNVQICVEGEVDGDKVAFVGSDTLVGLIGNGKSVQDNLLTEGIIIRDLEEYSRLDNGA